MNDGEKKLPTIIKYTGNGKEVYLCGKSSVLKYLLNSLRSGNLKGTFNNWNKIRMSRSQKDFVALVNLGEGDHEYKFFVDGQWQTDPHAPIIETNDGYKNNQIHVQKEDFNAFDALDMDLQAVANVQAQRAKDSKKMAAQKQFGQDTPHLPPTGGIPTSGDPSRSHGSGPPILPPHLLQVILNKVTMISKKQSMFFN